MLWKTRNEDSHRAKTNPRQRFSSAIYELIIEAKQAGLYSDTIANVLEAHAQEARHQHLMRSM
jgi:hypothetical protein